jgi:glutamyl-tRNA synthetase
MCALYKDRCATVVELADWLAIYLLPAAPSAGDLEQHVPASLRPALQALQEAFAALPEWDKACIGAAVKQVLAAHALKMPQLAPAVRVLVSGRSQTPSIDAVLALFPRATVLERLEAPKDS